MQVLYILAWCNDVVGHISREWNFFCVCMCVKLQIPFSFLYQALAVAESSSL